MRSVLTAFKVLETVSGAQPVGVTEIARELNLPKSTVQRSLKALNEAGWIRCYNDAGLTRWVLTLKPLRVAATSGPLETLRQQALPIMETLRRQTSESVHLNVRDGDEMVVIEKLDSLLSVRTFNELGGRAPLHASATGKAILSLLDPGTLEALLGCKLIEYTSETITDPHVLGLHLDLVRELGYSTNRGEWREDVFSVAAPIRGYRLIEAALSISLPMSRHDANQVANWGALLVAATAQLSS